MSPAAGHRDEWGETAEQRHDRILARDLAWLTYQDAEQRAGSPPDGPAKLAFNAGYAAAHAATSETLTIARKVAAHWHAAAVSNLDGPTRDFWTAAGHSLGCVLAALAGETDPEQLGVDPEVLQ